MSDPGREIPAGLLEARERARRALDAAQAFGAHPLTPAERHRAERVVERELDFEGAGPLTPAELEACRVWLEGWQYVEELTRALHVDERISLTMGRLPDELVAKLIVVALTLEEANGGA